MSQDRDEYANRLPLDIRLAVDSLSGESNTEYAVVMLLSEKSSLRFKELREELDIHQQKLTDALDSLQHGGVVRKQVGERIGNQSTGAYELTTTGDRLLDGLYYASRPDDDFEEAITRREDRGAEDRDESLLTSQGSNSSVGAGTGDSATDENSILDDPEMVPGPSVGGLGRGTDTDTGEAHGQHARSAHNSDGEEERM